MYFSLKKKVSHLKPLHCEGDYDHFSPKFKCETIANVRPVGSGWLTKPCHKQLVFCKVGPLAPFRPLHVSLTPQEDQRDQAPTLY